VVRGVKTHKSFKADTLRLCFGCAVARSENLEQGTLVHGIDVELLVKDLNAAVPQASASN
jgi:hypothetical protein